VKNISHAAMIHNGSIPDMVISAFRCCRERHAWWSSGTKPECQQEAEESLQRYYLIQAV